MLSIDLSLDEPRTGVALMQWLDTATGERGLPFPPVPPALVDDMREYDGFRVGTRPAGLPMLDLNRWVAERLKYPDTDFLVYGTEGHGVVSQILHYYLVSGPLAVFFQHRLPGPYEAVQAPRMEELLAELPGLLALSLSARDSGRLAEGESLLWVDSDLSFRAWTKLRLGTPLDWHGGDMIQGLRAELAH